MSDELKDRLQNAFPPDSDQNVIRGVREGILLADGILENEPFLKTLLGKDLRGHLRRAGVLFRLNDLCTHGDLPFKSQINKMPNGNWHWLELESDLFRAHICRTDQPDAFPVEAQSRQDARLSSQPDLFDGTVVPFKKLADEVGLLYAWLTFGAAINGDINHLWWKMPAKEEDSWLAQIDVMRREASSAIAPSPETSPSPTLALKFKDHIEEALSKQPGDKTGSN